MIRPGPILMFLLIIQVGIVLFYDNSDVNQVDLNPYNFTGNGSYNGNGGIVDEAVQAAADKSYSIWTFLFTPFNWSDTSNSFLGVLLGLIVVGGAVAIGASFVYKLEINVLFVFFVFLLFLGAIPLTNLYMVVYNNAGYFMCAQDLDTFDDPNYSLILTGDNTINNYFGTNCLPATIFCLLTVGILNIIWVMSCVSWWSGRQFM